MQHQNYELDCIENGKEQYHVPVDDNVLVTQAAKRLKVAERKVEKFKGFSKETLVKHKVRKAKYEKTLARLA